MPETSTLTSYTGKLRREELATCERRRQPQRTHRFLITRLWDTLIETHPSWRNTANTFSLQDVLSVGVDRMQRNFEPRGALPGHSTSSA
jgi:hypothetical protein